MIRTLRLWAGILLPALFLSVALPAGPAGAMGSGPKIGSAAFRSLGVWDESRRIRFDLAVWYPGGSSGASSNMEGRHFEAGTGRPHPGFYPIILISHDAAGNRFDCGDLAASLASRGFMVIAPTQVGDNSREESGIYSLQNLIDRPRLLLLSLETVLNSPDLGPLADESRIGLIGVGYGAITAMQMLGARPDPDRLTTFCPKVEYADIFCTGWSGRSMAALGPQLRAATKREGDGLLTPSLAMYAPELEPAPESKAGQEDPSGKLSPGATAAAKLAAVAATAEEERLGYAVALDFQGGPRYGTLSGSQFVYIDPPDAFNPLPIMAKEKSPEAPQAQPVGAHAQQALRRLPNNRAIRAAALLAPAGGMLFSPEDLHRVIVPVALVEAGKDEVYPPERHAQPYFSGLPSPPETLRLKNADHYSLFAPCDLDKIAGVECGRVIGNARSELAETRDTFLASFFLSALGGPEPPAPPGTYMIKPSPAPPADTNGTSPTGGR